jgi:hypothetical protein
MNRGLFFSGTVFAMMRTAPLKIPADPTPAMARPTINVVLFGATAQIKLPTSKMKMATR